MRGKSRKGGKKETKNVWWQFFLLEEFMDNHISKCLVGEMYKCVT